jgi:hypothetical protein
MTEDRNKEVQLVVTKYKPLLLKFAKKFLAKYHNDDTIKDIDDFLQEFSLTVLKLYKSYKKSIERHNSNWAAMLYMTFYSDRFYYKSKKKKTRDISLDPEYQELVLFENENHDNDFAVMVRDIETVLTDKEKELFSRMIDPKFSIKGETKRSGKPYAQIQRSVKTIKDKVHDVVDEDNV